MSDKQVAAKRLTTFRKRPGALLNSLDQLPRVGASTRRSGVSARSGLATSAPTTLRFASLSASAAVADIPESSVPVVTTSTAAVAASATAPTTITMTTSTVAAMTTTGPAHAPSSTAIMIAGAVTRRSAKRSAGKFVISTARDFSSAHIATTTTTSTVATSTTASATGSVVASSNTSQAKPHACFPEKLYQAILDGHEKDIRKRMEKGDSIFAVLDPDLHGAGFPRRSDREFTLLEFAIQSNQPECAEVMLRHCRPRDAAQRGARLLDMLDDALLLQDWELVHFLLDQCQDLGLRLRSKSFVHTFRFLVRFDEMRLAGLVLEIGPARSLSEKQLGFVTHNAFKFGRRTLIETLLRLYPEVLSLRACSGPRVLDHANGEALAVLLSRGFALPEMNGRQLADVLERLLLAAEQAMACDLLAQHPAPDLPWGELLQPAIGVGAGRFLAQLLERLPAQDPGLQDALHAALCSAIRLGYAAGVQALCAHGVSFFSRLLEADSLLNDLVSKEKTYSLSAWMATGPVAVESVFLRAIVQNKVQLLSELQGQLKLSFCAQMSANLAGPQPGAVCTASLADMLKRLRLAASIPQPLQPYQMVCAMAQWGLCWSMSHHMAALYESLAGAGFTPSTHTEQQFLLAMASLLASIGSAAPIAAAVEGESSDTLQTQRYALSVLGDRVLDHICQSLQSELLLEMRRVPGPAGNLGQRLQQSMGLPAELAGMVQEACDRVLQDLGETARQDPGTPGRVVQALLQRMQQGAAPALEYGEPNSVWKTTSWNRLLAACLLLTGKACQ